MPFVEYFHRRRVDLAPYFEAAKIEPGQVRDEDGWITKQQLYRFLNHLAKGEKIPELGFVVGEALTPQSVAGLGVAMAGCETLGEAIRTFCEVINRSSEENRSWIEETEGELWLFNETANPFEADRRIADHAGLMTLINLVRLGTGSSWYPAEVSLQSGYTAAPMRVAAFRETQFHFDQPATGLACPARSLLLSISPVVTEGGSSLLSEEEPPVDKLRRLLRAIIGVGGMGPTARLMAELVETSPRTLHRRLTEGGTSYRKLLDEVRLERAAERLSRDEVSVKELAYELGYSGPNNFIRAFKRLTGRTPVAFRENAE